LKFRSVALPLAGEPSLGIISNAGRRVCPRTIRRSGRGPNPQAFIENNCETLTDEDVAIVLEDAYVPRNYFRNPTLLTWFK